MDRREVIKAGAVTSILSSLPLAMPASAKQGGFEQLKNPKARLDAGKVPVIEFFWYGCGHCFHFEPSVHKWEKTLAKDVSFTQIPVGWNDPRGVFQRHQKLFYALEAMGKLESVHAKVFDAIHLDKKQLGTDEQIFDFAQSVGIDRNAFANNYKSFAVATKVGQATELTKQFEIKGVPCMVVDGKFLTSSTLAGSEADMLRVVDSLIERQRRAG